MTCRVEIETEERWRSFLWRVAKQEAYDAIDEMQRLEHKATSDRLYKMFDVGTAIYAKRFGQEWVPF